MSDHILLLLSVCSYMHGSITLHTGIYSLFQVQYIPWYFFGLMTKLMEPLQIQWPINDLLTTREK